jgi:Glutathione-dependent formaldehyde-activating enzyme
MPCTATVRSVESFRVRRFQPLAGLPSQAWHGSKSGNTSGHSGQLQGIRIHNLMAEWRPRSVTLDHGMLNHAPSFHVMKGAERISHYHKSENTVLSFRRVCGSSLYAEKVNKGMVHVWLGTFNESPRVRPQAHVFVDFKAPWYEIKDELVRFEAMPPVNKEAT